MIVASVLIALIALAVVALVGWPVIADRAPAADEFPVDPARVALEDEIAASLRAIKDLRFDHEAGNLSDEDFAVLERAERANAARLIRRRTQDDEVS